MPFQPDTQHMLDVLANRRPARLPIYEHIISPKIMEQVLDVRFEDLEGGDRHDLKEFFRHYCRFWPAWVMTWSPTRRASRRPCPDTARSVAARVPSKTGRTSSDTVGRAARDLLGIRGSEAQCTRPPAAPGGEGARRRGNGVFEISEDLVGFESLAYLRADDPRPLPPSTGGSAT